MFVEVEIHFTMDMEYPGLVFADTTYPWRDRSTAGPTVSTQTPGNQGE